MCSVGCCIRFVRLFALILCCLSPFAVGSTPPSKNQSFVNALPGAERKFTIKDNGREIHKSQFVHLGAEAEESTRFIVKLEEQALAPYIHAQKRKMGVESRSLKAQNRQQLTKAVQSQQQKLRESQQKLAAKMLNERLATGIHREFTYLINGMAISASPRDIEKIKRLPGVVSVTPDTRVSASMARSAELLELPKVWQRNDSRHYPLTGWGIKVGVLDSGIDYRHPDLGGCLGEGCKVVAAYNLVEDDTAEDGMDVYGHGTHVAGTIAAKGEIRGIAPDAKLYTFKVLGDDGYGLESGIIAGMELAADPDGDPLTDDGMDVVNMSLAGRGGPDAPMSEAANALVDAGVITLVAASNNGYYYRIDSPGNAEKVITVGATDHEDQIAYFSSRGPVSGVSYIKPELVAPGVEIVSTVPDGKYMPEDGTSMATPHVAGAAVLLKQMYPDLTPEEAKSLLVANAVDIGLDVYTQGAGRLDILAALDAKFVSTPAQLYFGRVDLKSSNWRAEKTLNVKNISDTDQRVTLSSVAGKLPSGASLSIPGTKTANLAPGESRSWTVSLSVNSLVPFPENVPMHYESALRLQQSSGYLRVPVAFTKAALIKIDAPPGLYNTVVYGEDKFAHYSEMGSCGWSMPKEGIQVVPGRYSLVFTFIGGEGCREGLSYVFRENLRVDGDIAIKVSPDDAIYDISIDKIVDDKGDAIPVDKFRSKYVSVDYEFTPFNMDSSFYDVFTDHTVIRTSKVSSNFRITVSPVLELADPESGEFEFFSSQLYLKGGIKKSVSFDVDARKMGRVDFEYKDQKKLADGVMLAIGLKALETFNYKAHRTHRYILPEIHYRPFKARVYRDLISLESFEYYPVFHVLEDPKDAFYYTQLFESGPLAFFDKTGYVVINDEFKGQKAVAYESVDNRFSIENNGYFFSGALFKMTYSTGDTVGLGDYSNFSYGISHQRDEMKNAYWDDAFYQFFCNQQPLAEEDLNSTQTSIHLFEKKCSRFDASIRMKTRFMGMEDESFVEMTLNPNSPLYAGSWFAETPVIEDVSFISDGKKTRIFTGNAQVAVKLSPSRATSTRSVNVTLEYRLEGDGEWKRLTTTKRGNIYSAKIPTASEPSLGSLRISVRDSDGNTVVQTLNSIFLVTDGDLPARFKPPVFPVLKPLTIEATDTWTPLDSSPPVAIDPIDGEIRARISGDKYAPLGPTRIFWVATNSRGLITIAEQRIEIIDTTPPVISLRPNIVVNATGELTEVDTGTVTAVDLVDKVVAVTPDRTGPFPVGKTTVIWTATDSTGNTATREQQINVVASRAPSVPQAPPSSGKSGGGMADVLVLLALVLLGFLPCVKRRLGCAAAETGADGHDFFCRHLDRQGL